LKILNLDLNVLLKCSEKKNKVENVDAVERKKGVYFLIQGRAKGMLQQQSATAMAMAPK